MMAAMHIVQISKFSYLECYGGIEQAMRNIALYTKPLGCDHTVLVTSPHVQKIQIDETPEARIVRFPMTVNLASCPMSMSMALHAKSYLQQADIIHYHFPWPFGEMLHLGYGIKKPSLATYHSDIVKQKILKIFYDPFMRAFLKRVNKIVATSPQYVESSPVLESFKDKCTVIPMGIDQATYPQASIQKQEYWSKQLGNKFILFIGVLRYYKGLHYLLEALKGTTITVAIVGAGPCETELKKQAKGLPHVHFLGAVSDDDKTALLETCRAVILPSHLRSEALGLSLVEGLMYGKPLISCEIGTGTSFVNENKVTGFVVPPENPAALRQAMQTLIENDALAQRMGNAAKQRFEHIFTARKMAEAYVKLYWSISKPQ
jgi:rhamnosyl/mannosyltransferase